MPERTVSSTKLTLGTIIASAKLRLFESATYGVDVLEVDMPPMDSDHRETSETHCFKCAPAEKLTTPFPGTKFAISSMKSASFVSSSDKMVRTKALSNRDSIACKMAALATAKPGAWFAVSLTPKRIAARSKARTYTRPTHSPSPFNLFRVSSDSTAHSSSPEHMMDGYIARRHTASNANANVSSLNFLASSQTAERVLPFDFKPLANAAICTQIATSCFGSSNAYPRMHPLNASRTR
mmetsp:Transcript_2795/g.8612  ORF Transcript_2795/g.8612 Transcript_2795/m.8612 type:complete len:238 (+) Transcript_2795:518-1231(+)